MKIMPIFEIQRAPWNQDVYVSRKSIIKILWFKENLFQQTLHRAIESWIGSGAKHLGPHSQLKNRLSEIYPFGFLRILESKKKTLENKLQK